MLWSSGPNTLSAGGRRMVRGIRRARRQDAVRLTCNDVAGRRMDVEGRMVPGGCLHGGAGRLRAAVRGGAPLHCCLTCTAGVSSSCDGSCSTRPPCPVIVRMGDPGDAAYEASSAGAAGEDFSLSRFLFLVTDGADVEGMSRWDHCSGASRCGGWWRGRVGPDSVQCLLEGCSTARGGWGIRMSGGMVKGREVKG